MFRSESLINNLLIEVETLSHRITNIHSAYRNTSNVSLKERLFYENKSICKRLSEIFSIAKVLKDRNKQKISLSGLLIEKCKRTIAKRRIENNLFFL